ncbi:MULTISPECIES: peptidoglycan-binding protein [unclassified Roseovarius]|uniref:peptidoglycan-binding domain-containing protein n=1 Tax=unclassified Roseovarius TaxID=2614913 RepID=UPI00273EA4EC|nr:MULTISPECIES: peptidoglycan-binding domain-containing protein [unclassified Roseovarius]
MIRSLPCLLMAVSLAAGCAVPLPGTEPELPDGAATAPPGAKPGTCWGKNVSPAVVETVTEQVLVQPAELRSDGSVSQPAIYRTETRQAIVRERDETWFETPCAAVQTPEFVATLQRALAARNLYPGPITGQIDARTRAAIRAYQAPQGLDSGILSMAAARKLGLVAVERPE